MFNKLKKLILQWKKQVTDMLNEVKINQFPGEVTPMPRRAEPEPGMSRQGGNTGVPIPTRMAAPVAGTSSRQQNTSLPPPVDDNVTQQARARQIADRAILEAERFRAAVAAPTGNIITEMAPPVDYSFNDDQVGNFCQVSNHVDVSTTV